MNQLEELRLHVELTSPPNFHHLPRLKMLRFLRFGWVADRGNLTLEAPLNLVASHWLAKMTSLTSLTVRLHDLPPPGCSDCFLALCFANLETLNLFDTERTHGGDFVRRILPFCGETLKVLKLGAIRDARSLDVTDRDLVNLNELEIGEGGEVLLQNLSAQSLTRLTRFKLCGDEFSDESSAAVAFLQRICRASAATLRHLDFECNFPVDKLSQLMEVLSSLKNLVTLRLFIYQGAMSYVGKQAKTKSLRKLFMSCNKLFPLDLCGESDLDDLSSFPAMKEFEVILATGGHPRLGGQPDTYAYTLKKTCFGEIKRFLSLCPPPTGDAAKYITIDPFHIRTNEIPQ